MSVLRKNLGRVVLLTLVIYFSWIVIRSGGKLFDEKIGMSVSRKFSRYRLFPSMSICMQVENITKNIDVNLHRVLDNVLISIYHRNLSDTG